jgi:pyruvate formate lyase activating enzyme
MQDGGARRFERGFCDGCGKCAESCPSGALSLCGQKWKLADLTAGLLKDRVYYLRTGGGVMLSGGECLLYPDGALTLLESLKAEGVHTVVETCLHVPWPGVETAVPFTDMFLVDMKHMDTERHKASAGYGNETILRNFKLLAAAHGDVTIRVPLIPGVNDSDENLCQTALAALSIGGGVRRMELLKYNALGNPKYDSLGKKAVVFADNAQSDGEMAVKCDMINRLAGVDGFAYFKA